MPVPAATAGMFADLPVGTVGPLVQVGPPVWSSATRHKWTILATFLVVAGGIVAALWLCISPQYRAGAEIRVRPIIPRLVYPTDENGRIPLYESFMNTQAAVVSSPTVLQRVLDEPAVRATGWFSGRRRGPMGNWMTDERPPVERLRESLEVRPRGRTEIIDVSMHAGDPQDAKTIVNTVLDQYMGYIRESSDRTSDVLYHQLLQQYRALSEDIDRREQVVARLSKEFGADAPETLISRKRLRLEELDATLTDVRRQIAILQWQEDEWRNMLMQETQTAQVASTQPTALAAKPHYAADGEWRRLRMNLKALEHEQEVQSEQLGPGHPKMVALAKRIKFAADMITSREAQLDQQWRLYPGQLQNGEEATAGEPSIANELAAVREKVKLLRFREQLLVDDLAAQKADWEKTLDNAAALAREQQMIARKREVFADVRRRKDQREMERNVPGSVEILTRAFAPTKAARDFRIVGSLAAVVLGAICGFGLAFVRAGRNPVVREVRELHHPAAGPFLGHLPLLNRKHESTPEESLLVNEGIRMVRTALIAHMENHEGNSVLVTSAGRGTGKSTVAGLLARSFARCNIKVLLIDADLRTRAMSRRFGLTSNRGLIGALTEGLADGEAIMQTDMPSLNVLPAGTHPGRVDPEIISNGKLDACMDRWRQQFDIVLLDSPPVLNVADGRILSRHTDGVVVVVREDVSLRSDVAEALRSIHDWGGRLWGTVFIGALRRMTYGYE